MFVSSISLKAFVNSLTHVLSCATTAFIFNKEFNNTQSHHQYVDKNHTNNN